MTAERCWNVCLTTRIACALILNATCVPPSRYRRYVRRAAAARYWIARADGLRAAYEQRPDCATPGEAWTAYRAVRSASPLGTRLRDRPAYYTLRAARGLAWRARRAALREGATPVIGRIAEQALLRAAFYGDFTRRQGANLGAQVRSIHSALTAGEVTPESAIESALDAAEALM